MFLFSQLHFIELTEISILFRLQKIGDRTWVAFDASESSTNVTKDVNNETFTLNPEPREKSLYRGSENYFSHRLVLSVHYFIWA